MTALTRPAAPSSCTQMMNGYTDIAGGILAKVSTSDVGSDGLLTAGGATRVIGELRTAGIIPTAPDLSKFNTKVWSAPDQNNVSGNDQLAVYVSAQNTLIANIEVEYNYVKSYYEKAISCLVDAIKEFTSATNDTTRTTINNNQVTPYRSKSIEFNRKLNLLLDVSRKISEQLLADSQGYQTTINSDNTEFTKRKTRLEEQAKILNSENSASELHKRMVEYSAEKNRAHNNLLTMYSCLNIVAIAMLFYIAK